MSFRGGGRTGGAGREARSVVWITDHTGRAQFSVAFFHGNGGVWP